MVDPTIGVETLLGDPLPALWEVSLKRESMRFLRRRGNCLTKKDFSRLINAILAGPPRAGYRDMSDKEWSEIRDHTVRVYLYKLIESGAVLPKFAQREFDRIQKEIPWTPRGDQSEEFSIFMTSGWGPYTEEGELEDFAGMSLDDFQKWAAGQSDRRWDCTGGWPLFCDAKPDIALSLLKNLGEKGEWHSAPWHDALSRFREGAKKLPKRHQQRHQRETAYLLTIMPLDTLATLGVTSAWWLESVRSSLGKRARVTLLGNIWDASINQKWEGEIDFDATLNQSGGVLASVLVGELGERCPTVMAGENPGIPRLLRQHFELIQNGKSPSAKLARVRLSNNLHYLFRVDREWAVKALLQRMDPDDSAKFEPALWEGYLWSPRISDDLLESLKPLLFKVLERPELISDRIQAHAFEIFIVAAVPPDRGINVREAKEVLQATPPKHLAQAAWMLKNMLSSAGEKATALWQETIGPWYKEAWPKHGQAKSESVSKNLALMAMETGDAFPDALSIIENSLLPEKWGLTISNLKEKELQKRFPEAAWRMIQRLVDINTQLAGSEIIEILEDISQAHPPIADYDDFKRLRRKVQS